MHFILYRSTKFTIFFRDRLTKFAIYFDDRSSIRIFFQQSLWISRFCPSHLLQEFAILFLKHLTNFVIFSQDHSKKFVIFYAVSFWICFFPRPNVEFFIETIWRILHFFEEIRRISWFFLDKLTNLVFFPAADCRNSRYFSAADWRKRYLFLWPFDKINDFLRDRSSNFTIFSIIWRILTPPPRDHFMHFAFFFTETIWLFFVFPRYHCRISQYFPQNNLTDFSPRPVDEIRNLFPHLFDKISYFFCDRSQFSRFLPRSLFEFRDFIIGTHVRNFETFFRKHLTNFVIFLSWSFTKFIFFSSRDCRNCDLFYTANYSFYYYYSRQIDSIFYWFPRSFDTFFIETLWQILLILSISFNEFRFFP